MPSLDNKIGKIIIYLLIVFCMSFGPPLLSWPFFATMPSQLSAAVQFAGVVLTFAGLFFILILEDFDEN